MKTLSLALAAIALCAAAWLALESADQRRRLASFETKLKVIQYLQGVRYAERTITVADVPSHLQVWLERFEGGTNVEPGRPDRSHGSGPFRIQGSTTLYAAAWEGPSRPGTATIALSFPDLGWMLQYPVETWSSRGRETRRCSPWSAAASSTRRSSHRGSWARRARASTRWWSGWRSSRIPIPTSSDPWALGFASQSRQD